jgi:hypothetical protein
LEISSHDNALLNLYHRHFLHLYASLKNVH